MSPEDIMVLKQRVIDFLYESGNYVVLRSNKYYVTKCPFCGDSIDPRKVHLYVKIDKDDNGAMVYYCFKCNEGGMLTSSVLSTMGCDDQDLLTSLDNFNKTCNRNTGSKVENRSRLFSFKLPEYRYDKKYQYITNRLGLEIGEEEFHKMKLIPSITEFLRLNKLEPRINPYMLKNMDMNYLGFMSYGNSHILLRDVSGKQNFSWLKYPITEESSENRLFYSMESQIDLFTKEEININLAEGVFDILSVCYQFDHNTDLDLNISVTGKYYERILAMLIGMGFVGSNIIVNIFADNDEIFNPSAKNPTTITYFRKILHPYRYLFGKINIYYNTIGKDFGVQRKEIKVKKYTI